MSDLFDQFLPDLLQREGGGAYTDRPADRGGPTRWGVTAKKLGEFRKLNGPASADQVQALTRDEASLIYREDYFTGPGFDVVSRVSPRIGEELLDTGVNMGTAWPSRWLQEDLNLLNRQGRDYPDIIIDGSVGLKTVDALRGLIRVRGQRMAEDLLLKALNGDQWARYKAIASSGGPDNAQEANVVGWLGQRVGALA